MKSNKTQFRSVIWTGILIILMMTEGTVLGQTPNYFIYPDAFGKGIYKHTLGLGISDLPEDQVEESSDFIRAPLINYQARFGLPNNFNIYGGVHTNIVT